MIRLAIVTTHPIQYYAPVFRMLAERGNIAIKVFYTWGEDGLHKYDPGFGKAVSWDIPLLEGYDYDWVLNTSKNPGSHHRDGIVNPSLIQDLETWGADAVLVYGWNYHSHFKVMCHFKGRIPVLFRGDSTLLNEQPGIKKHLRRLVLSYVYRYVDKALYVGTQNKRYFMAHGLREEQLVFAPHAVDNARFADSNHDEPSRILRLELGFKPEDRILLFAGKLDIVKNPAILVTAVKTYNRTAKTPWKLLMVGNGYLEKQLKTMASDDPSIRFLPFQNQSKMPMLFRVGDVYCLPSKSETWGLAVNEAMACGRTILISNECGCATDLVNNGRNGFVFDAFNTKTLFTCLEKLTQVDLKAMGACSAESITPWNFEVQCKGIELACINQPAS